jgi:hypothetical protein
MHRVYKGGIETASLYHVRKIPIRVEIEREGIEQLYCNHTVVLLITTGELISIG